MKETPSAVLVADPAGAIPLTRADLEEAAVKLNLHVIDYRDFILLKWANKQLEIHRLQVNAADLLEEMEDA